MTWIVFDTAKIVDFTTGKHEAVIMAAGVQGFRDVIPCPNCGALRAVQLKHPQRWACRGCGHPREISL